MFRYADFIISAYIDPYLTLDVGCGSSKHGDIGFDIYPRQGVDLVADAHHIPFKDECFDEVISVCVLEHLHSCGVALREQKRVLKPGGKVICVTDAPYWRWLIRIKGYADLLNPSAKGIDHADYFKDWDEHQNQHFMMFSEGHLRNLFTYIGFKITKIAPTPSYKKLDRIFSRIPFLKHISYGQIRIEGKKP